MRNPIIAGARVYLRPLEPPDAEQRARYAANEPESFFEERLPVSQLLFEHDIASHYERQPPENLSFAVCLLEDDRFIGDVELMDIDWVNRTAETGSWIGDPAYRGKGYGTEAKHLLLEIAFERLQLHVLVSYVWEPNTRSAAALAKQGYRPAGRYIADHHQAGVWKDALIFDVKRDEWLAARDAWRAGAG